VADRAQTEVYHDTLDKVYGALRKLGHSESQIMDIVNEILNAGILFRERVRDDAS
jgi:flagellar basal body P-ring protein FlgI